jgi:hypothetical protein
LYFLNQLQKQEGWRNAPIVMLHERVVEYMDKSEEEFQQVLAEVTGFLSEQKISLAAIIDASTENLEKLQLLDETSEILLEPKMNEDLSSYMR